MLVPVIAFALLSARTPMSVTVDIKDGDVITVERQITAKVLAENQVNQVDFYVNDDLRESDTSIPYQFKVDPLAENEGPAKLKFVAYTNQGQNAKAEVNITFDSGVSKGADFHLEAAKDAFVNSNWNKVILEGRIALKAKPDLAPAKLLISRAFLKMAVYDRAEQFASDVATADPNNREAQQLLIGITLERAFYGFYAAEDRAKAMPTLAQALNTASVARMKLLEENFSKVGEATPDNLLKYADEAIRDLRFSAATAALQGPFRSKPTKELGNRLGFAQLRMGLFEDLRRTLDDLKRTNQLDAYGYALTAVLESIRGHDKETTEALQQALVENPDDDGVKTAMLFVNLRKRDLNVLRRLVLNLEKVPPRPEFTYYMSTGWNAMRNLGNADTYFRSTILQEPAFYDMYLERGNEALTNLALQRAKTPQDVARETQFALVYYGAAHSIKPDAVETITGIALLKKLQGDPSEALNFARAASKAGPDYAAGHYLASCIISDVQVASLGVINRMKAKATVNGKISPEKAEEISKAQFEADKLHGEALAELKIAQEKDPAHLGGTIMTPKLQDAFQYFIAYGRMPVMTAPR